MNCDNIFQQIPEALQDEIFTTLVDGKNIRIERIVSYGHHSEEDQWYDQNRDEWVIILRGHAKLMIDDGRLSVLEMAEGDYQLLPAHLRHRVLSSSTIEPTVWLAVHFNLAKK